MIYFTNEKPFVSDFGSRSDNSRNTLMNLAKSFENTELAKSQNIRLHLLDQRLSLILFVF